MKKVISLLIVFVLTISVCSCGNGSVSLPGFVYDGDMEVDCDGKTFNFASAGITAWYSSPENGVPTLAVERMMERYDDAAEKFNFVFSADLIDNENIVQLLATGEDVPEMIYVTSNYAYDLYKMNVLASLDEIETVDSSDLKWGEPNFIQIGNFHGEQFGFFPWNWEFVPEHVGSVLFNGEMISEYGGTNPYEMQENGLWNWENFESELKKFSVVDDSGIQRYGALMTTRFMAKAAIFSNGGSILSENENGGFDFVLDSPEALEALEFVSRLNKEGLIKDNGLVKDSDLTAFSVEKLAPYFIGESFYGTSFNPSSTTSQTWAPSALSYFGYMPFPTGPKGDPDTDLGGYTYRRLMLCYVTSLADIEADNIGAVVDYMFEPLDDTNEVAWKDYLETTIFSERDFDKCLNNFVSIFENVQYDYSVYIPESAYDSLDNTLNAIIDGTKSAAEGIASVKSLIVESIVD